MLALISGFCSMKRLGVFLLPLDGILVHHRLPPSILSGCPQRNLLVHICTPGCKNEREREREREREDLFL